LISRNCLESLPQYTDFCTNVAQAATQNLRNGFRYAWIKSRASFASTCIILYDGGAKRGAANYAEADVLNCHVINLADNPVRLNHIIKTFGDAGISFTRFDAVDRIRAVDHPLAKLLPPMKVRPLSPGELGCLLSHYEIWKIVERARDDFAAVFEDDAVIDPRLRTVLSERSLFPGDADLIKLETVNYPVQLGLVPSPAPYGMQYRRLLSQHKGTCGYIISKKAASYLVSSFHMFDAPIDEVIFSPNLPVSKNLTIYQIVPAMVVQDCRNPDRSMRHPDLNTTLYRERRFAFNPQGNLVQRAMRKLVRYYDSQRFSPVPFDNIRT
jgi:glycosyl transferase, family 25